jgi:hypothetical protein
LAHSAEPPRRQREEMIRIESYRHPANGSQNVGTPRSTRAAEAALVDSLQPATP